jgi:hypothetical protein
MTARAASYAELAVLARLSPSPEAPERVVDGTAGSDEVMGLSLVTGSPSDEPASPYQILDGDLTS